MRAPGRVILKAVQGSGWEAVQRYSLVEPMECGSGRRDHLEAMGPGWLAVFVEMNTSRFQWIKDLDVNGRLNSLMN